MGLEGRSSDFLHYSFYKLILSVPGDQGGKKNQKAKTETDRLFIICVIRPRCWGLILDCNKMNTDISRRQPSVCVSALAACIWTQHGSYLYSRSGRRAEGGGQKLSPFKCAILGKTSHNGDKPHAWRWQKTLQNHATRGRKKFGLF